MYKMDANGHFFLKLTTAKEAYLFMMLERDSSWKDLAVQDDGAIIVMYGIRQGRDADYEAMKHMI